MYYQRIVFAITALLLAALPSEARNLTPDEALNRLKSAANPLSRSVDPDAMQLLMTADRANGEAAIYVFGAPEISKGFVITSAESDLPALIGYSTTGSFDSENMPPALKAMIESYTMEVDYLVAHPESVISRSANDIGAPISPMLRSTWNQHEPYDRMTPVFNAKHAPTGCIATAMAQIMKHYTWPLKAEGIHSYEHHGTTYSIDFSKVKFDYSNMLDTYSAGKYTDIQANAVAELMKAAGYSANMKYDQKESAATLFDAGKAFVKYFSYSHGLQYLKRNYFGLDEWERIIYHEIASGRPVIYGGGPKKPEVTEQSSHAYVIHGYDGDGLFYVNWGWGGHYDGVFRLTLLDPYKKELIPSEWDGYTYNADAIIGIKPLDQEAHPSAQLLSTDEFEFKISGSSINLGFANTNGYLFSYLFDSTKGWLGMEFKSADTREISVIDKVYDLGNSVSDNLTFAIPALPDGEYKVTPVASFDKKDWTPVRCDIKYPNYAIVIIRGGKASLKDTVYGADLTFTNVKPIGLIGCGNPEVTITATLTNNGNADFDSELTLFLDKKSEYNQIIGTDYYMFCRAGGTSEITIKGHLYTEGPGQYEVYFADEDNHRVSDNIVINVIDYPEIELIEMKPIGEHLSGSGKCEYSVTLRNNGDLDLIDKIYGETSLVISTEVYPGASSMPLNIEIPKGGQRTFTIVMKSDLKPGSYPINAVIGEKSIPTNDIAISVSDKQFTPYTVEAESDLILYDGAADQKASFCFVRNQSNDAWVRASFSVYNDKGDFVNDYQVPDFYMRYNEPDTVIVTIAATDLIPNGYRPGKYTINVTDAGELICDDITLILRPSTWIDVKQPLTVYTNYRGGKISLCAHNYTDKDISDDISMKFTSLESGREYEASMPIDIAKGESEIEIPLDQTPLLGQEGLFNVICLSQNHSEISDAFIITAKPDINVDMPDEIYIDFDKIEGVTMVTLSNPGDLGTDLMLNLVVYSDASDDPALQMEWLQLTIPAKESKQIPIETAMINHFFGLAGLESGEYTARILSHTNQQLGERFKMIVGKSSTGINRVATDALLIVTSTAGISVSGLEVGTPIYVYNIDGRLVASTTADGSKTDIPVMTKGIYIIKAGTKTAKIVM